MRIKILPFSANIVTLDMVELVNEGYDEGQVICMSDGRAKYFIQKNLAEEFNYTIPDNDIRMLYKEFVETTDIKGKVDIFIKAFSKSVNEAVLEDGTEIHFRLDPENANDWFYYNNRLIEFYKSNFDDCSLEGLKNIFRKKQLNAPNKKKLIESELLKINKVLVDDKSKGLSFWYNASLNGNIPKNEHDYQILLSKKISYGIEFFLRGMAIAEYEHYLETIDATKLGDKGLQEDSITDLSQLFTSALEYDNIMKILVDKELCQEETFIWVDAKKGSLKMLASLIKHLHSKGYLKRKPLDSEVKMIALNSFKIDMSIDTVKKTKFDSFDFSFIPVVIKR